MEEVPRHAAPRKEEGAGGSVSSEGENAKKEEDKARGREPSGRFQTKAGLRRAEASTFFLVLPT